MHISITETIILSVKVALSATLLDLPFALFFGWLLARHEFRGKMLFGTLINLPLVLPPVVTGWFLLVLLGRNGIIGAWLYHWFGISLVFTWQAAALAAAVVSFPVFVRAVRVAIENVNPRYEEAALLLRTTPWQVFWKITFPLAANGVIAGALLAFARSLGEFGATIMVAGNIPGETRTIPLAIFSAVNQAGSDTQVLLLILASVVFAYGTLIISELLLRKWRQPVEEPNG